MLEKDNTGRRVLGSKPKSPCGPAGYETVNFSTKSNYFKISPENKEKCMINYCRWSCELVKDFSIEYYNNSTILRDNDRLVHIPKVDK